MAAYAALKAGIKAGQDLSQLGAEIGKLWSGIDQVKHNFQKAKNSPFRTAEEEAMSEFVAKKQAEDLEYNLREIVIHTRGISGWQELLRLRADIYKRRKEAEARAARERDELIELVLTIIAVVAAVIMITGLGAIAWTEYYK
tara:strand:+ start:3455 stop:3880 length:426 start_codon:yes stop_codon:yes gene_type:complete